MFGCWITTVLDRTDIRLQRSKWRVIALLEISDKSRRTATRDIENVIQHENLSANMRTRTDTDRRHVE